MFFRMRRQLVMSEVLRGLRIEEKAQRVRGLVRAAGGSFECQHGAR